jgi:hypothetical protein
MRITAAPFDARDAGLDRLLGRVLQRGIDRRVDAQAAFGDARGAEPLDEVAAHLLLEVQAERLLHLDVVRESDRRLPRAIELFGRDRAVRHHRLQDDRAAGDGAVEIHGRCVARR